MKTKKQNPPKGEKLTEEQIEWLNECTEGTTWKLNPQTGLVDVDGRFSCSEQDLSDFKGVRFGVVGGDFYCYRNQLTSLEGAPREVRGHFCCDNNLLTSLVGAPEKVGWGFSCRDNQLTSLEGAPRKVGKNFDCRNNLLTSLVGAPQEVRGGFYCENNRLTSLEGAPREVRGSFDCDDNPVPERTLKSIFSHMGRGGSYLKAVEYLWPKIPVDDQALLYRPEFKWVGAEEAKKLQAVGRFNKIKGIL